MNWDHGQPAVQTIEFILHNRATEPFTMVQWEMFQDWKAILESVLPVSHAEIVRHPALFTLDCDVRGYAASSPLSIPDHAVERIEACEAYRAGARYETPYLCCQ